MNIELRPVDSSLIKAAGYDAASHTLAIEFFAWRNPKTAQMERPVYHYANVLHADWAKFLAAESKGRWFQKTIKARPELFPFTKQEPVVVPDAK